MRWGMICGGQGASMQYWLVKSEPDAFSWDQQVANGVEPWTGVRNHTAKRNLKAMKTGDRAFFYHSNAGKEIVGVVEVVREAYPDPTAEAGGWVCVDMKAIGADAEAGDPGGDQGRSGVRRPGPGAPVAAFGRAGVEAALGPDLPDGRMEEVSDEARSPPPSPLPQGEGEKTRHSPSPCGRRPGEGVTALCRLDDLPDGGARGFPPAPGGFTGLVAMRAGRCGASST